MYGRDLEEDLKKELGGTFQEVCLALLVPQYEYLADCLHQALQVNITQLFHTSLSECRISLCEITRIQLFIHQL